MSTAPIDLTKRHNYPIVFDDAGDGRSHYLDRYTPEREDGAGTTLCGFSIDPFNIESDPLGYHGGIDCAECRAALVARVEGGADPTRIDRPHRFAPGDQVRHVDEAGLVPYTVEAQTWRVGNNGVLYPTYTLESPSVFGAERATDVLCTVDLVPAGDAGKSQDAPDDELPTPEPGTVWTLVVVGGNGKVAHVETFSSMPTFSAVDALASPSIGYGYGASAVITEGSIDGGDSVLIDRASDDRRTVKS